MIDGKVLFVHSDKFIIKVINDPNEPENKNKLVHLIKSECVPAEVKKGVFISFSGKKSEKKVRDTNTKEFKTVTIIVPDIFEISSKKNTFKTAAPKQKKVNAPDQDVNKNKSVKQPDKEASEKLVISATDQHLYLVGEIKIINGTRALIKHIGRTFENAKTKKQICYVYYEKPEVKAEDFMKATVDYYEVIDFIKKNGIKPRHKPEMVTQIKNAKVICDSRKKLEGNAWLAYDDEFMWYISYKLSPIALDNNIKIYNQMAQCWRISFRNVRQMMEKIQLIEQVLFQSDIIPTVENC